MEHHHHCLNCNNPLKDAFCSHCGQTASTHKYSIKHFIEHDIIHGIWHVDKGIFYTIKQLFTRPGHSIREFVEGKRSKHFNFVSLILICLAVSIFLDPYIKVQMKDLIWGTKDSQKMISDFDEFSTKYPRLIIAIYIPINALFSYLWFRKAKYNYSEHLVLNCYKSIGDTVVGLVFKAVTIFYANITVLSFVYYTIITGFGVIIYPIWFFGQFFAHSGYSKKALIWRSVLAAFSFSILVGLVTFVVMFFQGYSQNIGK